MTAAGIGPFDSESIEAAQQVILSWAHSGDPAEVGSARPVLSAAVSVVDRQALAKRPEDVLRATAAGQSSPRYRLLAEAGIADLFPAEGPESARAGSSDADQIRTLINAVEGEWEGDSGPIAAGARQALDNVREQIALRFGPPVPTEGEAE